jgi:hypothetical protein
MSAAVLLLPVGLIRLRKAIRRMRDCEAPNRPEPQQQSVQNEE